MSFQPEGVRVARYISACYMFHQTLLQATMHSIIGIGFFSYFSFSYYFCYTGDAIPMESNLEWMETPFYNK